MNILGIVTKEAFAYLNFEKVVILDNCNELLNILSVISLFCIDFAIVTSDGVHFVF